MRAFHSTHLREFPADGKKREEPLHTSKLCGCRFSFVRTLINAYSDQIAKHQGFVYCPGSLDIIFEEDTRYVSPKKMPTIYYIAVDKRNQMHYRRQAHDFRVYVGLLFEEAY